MEYIRPRYLLHNQRNVFIFFVTRRAQECGNSREPSDPVNWYAVRNKMRDIKGKFVGNYECQDSPPSPSTRSKRSVISRDHVHRRYAMPKSCARTSSGLRHSPSRACGLVKIIAPAESSDTTSHSPTSWSICGLQLPETEMAEKRDMPVEFSKSLDTHSVFLPQPNGVRRAKPIAIPMSLISALDPSKPMIRSFALSGAEGRVFTPLTPFFFA